MEINARRRVWYKKNRKTECARARVNYRKNKERIIKQQVAYQRQNRDRHRNKRFNAIGNPNADKEILFFIKKKRIGASTPKYRALADSEFIKSNEAEFHTERVPIYKDK